VDDERGLFLHRYDEDFLRPSRFFSLVSSCHLLIFSFSTRFRLTCQVAR
jgi:hypothetical protein